MHVGSIFVKQGLEVILSSCRMSLFARSRSSELSKLRSSCLGSSKTAFLEAQNHNQTPAKSTSKTTSIAVVLSLAPMLTWKGLHSAPFVILFYVSFIFGLANLWRKMLVLECRVEFARLWLSFCRLFPIRLYRSHKQTQTNTNKDQDVYHSMIYCVIAPDSLYGLAHRSILRDAVSRCAMLCPAMRCDAMRCHVMLFRC